MGRKPKTKIDIEDNFLEESNEDIIDQTEDSYESNEYDDYYSNTEDLFDDINEEERLANELKEEKKKRKKEFYVKGADLKAEIQKYHDSKKLNEDGRRNCF